MVRSKDILEKMLHRGKLEAILLVGIDVVDYSVVVFKAEKPLCITGAKIKHGILQVPV